MAELTAADRVVRASDSLIFEDSRKTWNPKWLLCAFTPNLNNPRTMQIASRFSASIPQTNLFIPSSFQLNYNGGCSLVAELTVVVREARVRFSASTFGIERGRCSSEQFALCNKVNLNKPCAMQIANRFSTSTFGIKRGRGPISLNITKNLNKGLSACCPHM